MKLSFIPEKIEWRCHACNRMLEPGHAELQYLGASFSVELPVCPSCGLVLITEELATGRMLEAERLLEDK